MLRSDLVTLPPATDQHVSHCISNVIHIQTVTCSPETHSAFPLPGLFGRSPSGDSVRTVPVVFYDTPLISNFSLFSFWQKKLADELRKAPRASRRRQRLTDRRFKLAGLRLATRLFTLGCLGRLSPRYNVTARMAGGKRCAHHGMGSNVAAVTAAALRKPALALLALFSKQQLLAKRLARWLSASSSSTYQRTRVRAYSMGMIDTSGGGRWGYSSPDTPGRNSPVDDDPDMQKKRQAAARYACQLLGGRGLNAGASLLPLPRHRSPLLCFLRAPTYRLTSPTTKTHPYALVCGIFA